MKKLAPRPLRTMRYKGKVLTFKHQIKTGQCQSCWSPNLTTVLHHIRYDDNNPLAHTIELCQHCHNKAHYRGFLLKPIVPT